MSPTPRTSPTSPTSRRHVAHVERRHAAHVTSPRHVTAPMSPRPRHGPHINVPTPRQGDNAHAARDPRPVAGTYINLHIDRVGQRLCGNFASFFRLNRVEISPQYGSSAGVMPRPTPTSRQPHHVLSPTSWRPRPRRRRTRPLGHSLNRATGRPPRSSCTRRQDLPRWCTRRRPGSRKRGRRKRRRRSRG
jgi:hypothetical protein